MKFFMTAAAIMLGAATTSYSADFQTEAVSPLVTPSPQAASWTGGYIGLTGGYGWMAGELPTHSAFSFSGDGAASGGMLGGFLGYDYQFSNQIVVGIEGDLAHNWNEKTYNITSPIPALNGQNVKVGTDWQGGVKARFGYGFDKALIYATGGWASTRLTGSFSLSGKDYDDVLNGWSLGAGLDYTFSERFFGRIEINYADFGETDILEDATSIPGLQDSRLTQTSLKAGLGVRF